MNFNRFVFMYAGISSLMILLGYMVKDAVNHLKGFDDSLYDFDDEEFRDGRS